MKPDYPTSSSILDFCDRYHIDKSTFYRRLEDMPRTIRVGGQQRILGADEKAWIERLQAEADARRTAA
ncbi:hypothetical protein [Thiohalocapsa marina]|uniref:hypothetical protein n=1 Tax=Thiohalocapsa marina TaxID=424902 RepID=UPI0036D91706